MNKIGKIGKIKEGLTEILKVEKKLNHSMCLFVAYYGHFYEYLLVRDQGHNLKQNR